MLADAEKKDHHCS